MMASGEGKIAFTSWKYSHYFQLESKGKNNVLVTCKLCPGSKSLSTANNSNSNLLKHLEKRHASTKLAAKAASETDSSEQHTPTPPKQQRLVFERLTHSQAQLDKTIARYVVENRLPISTVEDPAFRQIISMVPCTGGTRQMGRKTFSNYLEREYGKMENELKKAFEELNYISTTADIWSTQNRSYLGVTAHWINPTTLKHEKAALACKRVRGSHTYDVVASEIDHIHSLYGLSKKVTATVTDNGSNFVKAFKIYQPPDDESDDSGDDENEVTFTNVNNVLDDAPEYGIALPPHLRCASHTMNLVSCSDLEKWLTSNPAIKGLYRSATAKCTALWNKASRSTMASETVGDVFSKKLLVPCTTRWNSFHNAVARITEIPLNDLTIICDRLGLKCFSDRELQFLKEYCAITKPLTVALDILQGEDNCYYGTLLPTLEVLMAKTLEKREGLTVAMGLPDAIVHAIKTRFSTVLESKDAMVAAVSLPMFKLRWGKDQAKKDMVKGYLTAECHKVTSQPGPVQQPKVPPTPTPSTSTAQDFFNFGEEDDTFSSVESEIISYLRTPETEMHILQQFPTIKEVCLKKNAATPSSAPVERLFSLGSLVLCPKRNKLKDQRFEKLLLMRYNHWFQ